jgi:protein SCO1
MSYLVNLRKLVPAPRTSREHAIPKFAFVLFVWAVLIVVFVSGCRTEPASKRYHLSGSVLSKDQAQSTVTVDAKEIPGFMAAMAMPYPVKSPEMLDGLSAGDNITADVIVQGDRYWLEDITVRSRLNPPVAPSATALHIPQPGDRVPDFILVNQDGKRIALERYKGKVLLLTFIYTRCPFPDFCPRISHEFATLERSLRSDPALYQRTHLLTISFDPEHDSPGVLREYGLPLVENDAKAFKHWEFAVPRATALPEMARFFGFFYEQDSQAKGILTHSVVVAVIAPDGSIFKWYHGNDWHASDLLKDAAEASDK